MEILAVKRNGMESIKKKYDSYYLFSFITTVLSVVTYPLAVLFGGVLSYNKFDVYTNSEYDKVRLKDFTENFKKNWHRVFTYTVRSVIYVTIPVLIVFVGMVFTISLLTTIMLNAGSLRAMRVVSVIIEIITYTGTIGMIVVGIVRSIFTAAGSYIIYREPEITSKEALEKSSEIMKHYFFKYILLYIVLIPQAFQCVFFFFGLPKIEAATVEFFRQAYEERDRIVVPSSTPTFCPNCGAQVQTDTVFCNNCGTKLK